MQCKKGETFDDDKKLTEVINRQHENVKYLLDDKTYTAIFIFSMNKKQSFFSIFSTVLTNINCCLTI